MQFSLLPISLSLSLAVAATTTFSAAAISTSTTCAAQNVLDQCLVTGKPYYDACSPTDYACLCSKSTDILICYLQCPNDPGQPSAQSTKDTNCNNASIYGQTTQAAVSNPVSATSASATEASVTSNGAVKAASATSASAGSTATSKANAAGNLAAGAGSVMMGLAGVVAAVL